MGDRVAVCCDWDSPKEKKIGTPVTCLMTERDTARGYSSAALKKVIVQGALSRDSRVVCTCHRASISSIKRQGHVVALAGELGGAAYRTFLAMVHLRYSISLNQVVCNGILFFLFVIARGT